MVTGFQFKTLLAKVYIGHITQQDFRVNSGNTQAGQFTGITAAAQNTDQPLLILDINGAGGTVLKLAFYGLRHHGRGQSQTGEPVHININNKLRIADPY